MINGTIKNCFCITIQITCDSTEQCFSSLSLSLNFKLNDDKKIDKWQKTLKWFLCEIHHSLFFFQCWINHIKSKKLLQIVMSSFYIFEKKKTIQNTKRMYFCEWRWLMKHSIELTLFRKASHLFYKCQITIMNLVVLKWIYFCFQNHFRHVNKEVG